VYTHDAAGVVEHHTSVGVQDATVAHQSEDVVSDRLCDEGVVIQSPHVLQPVKDWLFVQRLGVEPTHVPITDRLGTSTFRYRRLVDERRNIKANRLKHATQ